MNKLEIGRDYEKEALNIVDMCKKGTVILGYFCIEDIEIVEKPTKKKKYVKLLVKHATNKRDNAFCVFDFNKHTINKDTEEFLFNIGDYVFLTAYENHNRYGIFKSINTIDLIDLRYELSIVEDTP